MTGEQTDLSGEAVEDDTEQHPDDEPPEKRCDVCGELVTIDDQEAVERWGQVVCWDCRDSPVAFMAFCTRCSWRKIHETTEYNRGQAKQNAQRDGNDHETTKEVFEDEPGHEKRVTEIAPGAFAFEPGKYDGYQMPRGPMGAEPHDTPVVTPAIGFCPRCHTNARGTTGVRGVFDCPGCTYVWKDQRVGEQTRTFEDYFSKS